MGLLCELGNFPPFPNYDPKGVKYISSLNILKMKICLPFLVLTYFTLPSKRAFGKGKLMYRKDKKTDIKHYKM